ncbi:MFS transporter [Horticoccus sp. 23ND18S-11]|uniref:MFS transporter n=1 Tax=Horticoccus sp. 23ND18S-11 TaxID=3391832 RepID=UPI0039C98C73
MSAPSNPPTAHDPYAALKIPNYRDYLAGSFFALLGRQAVTAVAIWQVYEWTHSSTALGLVGLVNVLPLLALSLPAGALADRWDRRKLIAAGTAVMAGVNLALGGVAYWHAAVPDLAPLRWANAALRQVALVFEHHGGDRPLRFDEPALPIVFLLLLAHACARILIWPARSSITPLLVPTRALSNAITWNTSTFEIATVAGPALGGFLIAFIGIPSVYALGAGLELLFLLTLRRVTYFAPPARSTLQRTWRDVLAGGEFIWRKKVILGASSLDLFAVLLGGATALLPVYADQILHVGPIGFGWLRAAPSLGAFAMAMWIAHRAPLAQPGRALLWSVAGFGAAVVVFGLSRWFWLSLVALFLTGAFDNISVVVRQSLVQLLTPDALRGRVTAVNQIFIGSSNEIGALRAGLMSALIGPVAAVVWGGIGTILVTVAIARAVPPLRHLPALHTLKPEE